MMASVVEHVNLSGSQLGAGCGLTLHGLSGRVCLIPPDGLEAPKWVGLSGCVGLESLDVSRLHPGFWVDLGEPKDGLHLRLPESGASVRFRFSLDVPRIDFSGRIDQCLIQCLSSEDWQQTRGIYLLGPLQGIRFVRGMRVARKPDIENHVRVDQSGRGLQIKALRRGVNPNELSWKLVEPVQSSPDLVSLAIGAGESRKSRNVGQGDEVDHPDSSQCGLVERLPYLTSSVVKAEPPIDPLILLCLLAWEGVDLGALWQIRCDLRSAEIERGDGRVFDADGDEGQLVWPRWGRRGSCGGSLRPWDLRLSLIRKEAGGYETDLAVGVTGADDLEDAATLADMLASVGNGHHMRKGMGDAIRGILNRFGEKAMAEADRNPLGSGISAGLSELMERHGLSRGQNIVVKMMLERAPRLDEAGCLDDLCGLIIDHAAPRDRITYGLKLLKMNFRQGRAMIASALRQPNRLSKKERSKALEYLMRAVD